MTEAKERPGSVVLLIHSRDRKGLVAAVTEFIYKNNGNVIALDQHVDARNRAFFMRVEWDLTDFTIPSAKIPEFFQVLVAERWGMQSELYFANETPRMAIFVSKRPFNNSLQGVPGQ